jgi:hypothetical protein
MELEHNVHMDALKKQLDQERESSSVIVDKILTDTWAQPNGQPVKYEVHKTVLVNCTCGILARLLGSSLICICIYIRMYMHVT